MPARKLPGLTSEPAPAGPIESEALAAVEEEHEANDAGLSPAEFARLRAEMARQWPLSAAPETR